MATSQPTSMTTAKTSTLAEDADKELTPTDTTEQPWTTVVKKGKGPLNGMGKVKGKGKGKEKVKVKNVPVNMATSQPTSMTAVKTSTLAEDVDKELTCAVCLSRYETPKVLPCLHTYCKGCLEDLVKKARDDQVTCPQCKEKHQLPEEGVDGFKTYFTIKNLLELLKVHEAADESETYTQVIRCSSGLDENDAVAYCSNCCCYFCETCWKYHQVFTRNHSTVSLEEIKHSDKPAGARSLQKVQHCKDHEDEVLKLFCKACKQVICRDCALVKHRDHDFVFIREIRPEIQQQLESLTKDVQAKEVEYKSYIEYMENIREIGTDTLTSCEREVNDTCHRLQEAIESRRAALIAQLHDIHDLEKKQVDSEADGLQFTLAKLSNSVGFTQQLLANGSDVEVVSMGVQAMQTLENMKRVNWNKDSVKPTLMRVKFDPNFEKYVNEFGVTSHEIQPEDILISGLPKESSANQELQFKVCLSEEISEKGYVAAGLVIQLTHTSTNDETVCSMRKIDLNTWAVSCIPKAAGEYKVSATLDHIETIPLTLNIPEPETTAITCEEEPVCVLEDQASDLPLSVDSKFTEKYYYTSTHTIPECSDDLTSVDFDKREKVDAPEEYRDCREDVFAFEKLHSNVDVPKKSTDSKKTFPSGMKASVDFSKREKVDAPKEYRDCREDVFAFEKLHSDVDVPKKSTDSKKTFPSGMKASVDFSKREKVGALKEYRDCREDVFAFEKHHGYVDVPKSTDSTKTCASPMKGSSVSSVQHTYIQEERNYSSYKTLPLQRSTIIPASESSKQLGAPKPPQLVESWSSSKSVGTTTSRARPQQGKFQSFNEPLKDDCPHQQHSGYRDVWAAPTVKKVKTGKSRIY